MTYRPGSAGPPPRRRRAAFAAESQGRGCGRPASEGKKKLIRAVEEFDRPYEMAALSGLALFATALMLGGMAYFAAGLAPLVFTRLPADIAGGFIRQVFPVYYLYVLATAVVAGAALLPLRPWDSLAMFAVAGGAGWLRQWLMPAINAASDAAKAGDAGAARRFARGYRLSVLLNLAQMAVGAAVLLRFVA